MARTSPPPNKPELLPGSKSKHCTLVQSLVKQVLSLVVQDIQVCLVPDKSVSYPLLLPSQRQLQRQHSVSISLIQLTFELQRFRQGEKQAYMCLYNQTITAVPL